MAPSHLQLALATNGLAAKNGSAPAGERRRWCGTSAVSSSQTVCPAGHQAEPESVGEGPADPEHLAENGEEEEEAVATETISKEEAAERLLVGLIRPPADGAA